VRLSRHAKNKARHAKLTLPEVLRICDLGREIGPDEDGNRRVVGRSDRGVEFVVVIALDDPQFLITLMEWRPR